MKHIIKSTIAVGEPQSAEWMTEPAEEGVSIAGTPIEKAWCEILMIQTAL